MGLLGLPAPRLSPALGDQSLSAEKHSLPLLDKLQQMELSLATMELTGPPEILP
jgi:hypothetical protein